MAFETRFHDLKFTLKLASLVSPPSVALHPQILRTLSQLAPVYYHQSTPNSQSHSVPGAIGLICAEELVKHSACAEPMTCIPGPQLSTFCPGNAEECRASDPLSSADRLIKTGRAH
ncbi:hypothetical protein N7470_006071 [Penicillium chermesinum]|nr:hypothetical protein N7470_006071 [Penicillium chermesinum]